MAPILLRSTSTVYVSISLLCALPLLSGCLLGVAARHAWPDAECQALRSDRERGVVDSTAWNQKKCDQIEREQLEEARPNVKEAER